MAPPPPMPYGRPGMMPPMYDPMGYYDQPQEGEGEGGGGGMFWGIMIFLVVAGGVGFAAYKYVEKKRKEKEDGAAIV